MRAIVISQPGGPEVLSVREVADPEPQAGQVVILIYATSLNRADLLQRGGNYQVPPDAPPYPGLECAGVIERIGEGVTAWQPGQRVMALLSGGGYAEKVAIAQETLMPMPERLSFEEAAAIPEAWLTAYSNLIQIGQLRAGERALIHAGGSGVGSAAIQLAKWKGATVVATASASKRAKVVALGTDLFVDYREGSFAERIETEFGKNSVDIIVDFIGAPYWEANLRVLALWGRLVFVGLMGGSEVQVNLGLFLSKKLSVHGSTLRDRTLLQKAHLVRAFISEVLPAFTTRELHPVLDAKRFGLEEIVEAHRYMEANENFGKIIVTVRS